MQRKKQNVASIEAQIAAIEARIRTGQVKNVWKAHNKVKVLKNDLNQLKHFEFLAR
jgi:hypothetical protein